MTTCQESKQQSRPTDAEKMQFVGRTQGDGMENSNSNLIKMERKARPSVLDSFTYRPTNLNQSVSSKPVVPAGIIVNLKPMRSASSSKLKKQQNQSQKDQRTILPKPKEPKFVPYEPYKAAINPIVPDQKTHHCHAKFEQTRRKVSRSQLSEPRSEEESVKEVQNEERMRELEAEKNHLESQLKFQIQVNGELKNLLVAAVGEDLETKVHLLAEDKLQLARALLNSAQRLNTHQEQTEWLAGQCEVWRSKFLASSLMVEELAKWKAALCQRTVDLEEAMRKLLDERKEIRELSLKTYKTLRFLRESFDPAGAAAAATMAAAASSKKRLHASNVLSLTRDCCHLAEILNVQLLGGMYDVQPTRKDVDNCEADCRTPAEKDAEQLLMTPNTLLSGRPDAACNAVMGAAVAVGANQMFFVRKGESGMACCSHCSGEIKQL